MPDLSTQTDDVHVIREIHLHYSHDNQEQAPLKDNGDVADCRDCSASESRESRGRHRFGC